MLQWNLTKNSTILGANKQQKMPPVPGTTQRFRRKESQPEMLHIMTPRITWIMVPTCPNSLSWGKVINPTLSWTHWWKIQYKYVYLPYLHIIPIIMDIQQQLYKHISMVFDPHGPCKHVSPCIYCEHEKSPLTMRQTFDMTYHASAYGVGIGAMVSW